MPVLHGIFVSTFSRNGVDSFDKLISGCGCFDSL